MKLYHHFRYRYFVCIPKQLTRIMRLTIIIIMLTLIQVSAASFAQKVTYIKDGTSLKELFKQIRKQTGYNVFYSDKKIDDRKKINVNFKASPLEVVLETCAAQHSMEYTIDDKNIYFKPKSASFIDKVIDYFSAIDVRGKVVDEQGLPLPGASVKVKGSTLGTVTDNEGDFFLKGVPEDAVIVIAYLGYKPRELKTSTGIGIIKLELAIADLNEVVMVDEKPV
ncbi:MAG: SusC/RagA family TonB-linked outer membrane protein, partial [Pedobacter sp.]